MRSILLVMLLLCSFHAVCETEEQIRNEIGYTANEAFAREDFALLDATAKKYLEEKTRTPSGLFKLDLFHFGLQNPMEGLYANDLPIDEIESKTRRWITKNPQSITAHITLAKIQNVRAWKARGSGYSYQVSEKAMRVFRSYIAKTKSTLEQSKSFAAKDPSWYGLMISVARDQGWNRFEFEKLLEEALNRHPDSLPLYLEAIVYLLPKWHGDAKQMDDFISASVRRTEKTKGTEMYARIYWYVADIEYKEEFFTKSKVSWPKMKASFETIVARYPDDHNLNAFARFACMANDKQKATELMKKVAEGDVAWSAWRPLNLLYRCADFTGIPHSSLSVH